MSCGLIGFGPAPQVINCGLGQQCVYVDNSSRELKYRLDKQ